MDAASGPPGVTQLPSQVSLAWTVRGSLQVASTMANLAKARKAGMLEVDVGVGDVVEGPY